MKHNFFLNRNLGILKIYIILLSLILVQSTSAQSDGEREYSVQLSQLPDSAIQLIKKLPSETKRFRYYKEIDGDEESFETKFKYNDLWYCIEFDLQGKIEDIEIIVEMDEININQKTAIKTYFKENFTKVNIEEIVLQFSNDEALEDYAFADYIMSGKTQILPTYEIEADAKGNGKRSIAEYSFDKMGKFVSSQLIHPKSYGYIKY